MIVLLLSLLCHLTFFSTAQYTPDSIEIKVGLKRVERFNRGYNKIKKLAYQYQVKPHPYPTLTMFEVEVGLQDPKKTRAEKKIIEGILNDFMDLLYGVTTRYTVGREILPANCSIRDVDQAIKDAKNKRFRDVYVHIAETYRRGDFTPQWTRNTGWDPTLKPVLVLISSHITGTVKLKYT